MNEAQYRQSILFLVVLVFMILLGSVFVGRYPQLGWMSPRLLWEDMLARRLVFSLRLPRLLTGLLLGMTLSATGAVLQMVFRNPLVEPGFMGVTQGAAFGAAIAILWMGRHPLLVELVATLFGLIGLFGSYTLSHHMRFGGWVLRLVLSGVAVSALFSAGLGILKYVADPLTELPELTFWLLGGLWNVTWRDFWYAVPFAVVGLTAVIVMRWRVNLLSLNDETAFSLGAAIGQERFVLLFTSVAATAALTSVSGTIGWVGLIIPHIARRLFGASGHRSIPAAMLLGGAFIVISDTLARTLLSGEIPLGILTSAIGAILFMYLMLRSGIQVRS